MTTDMPAARPAGESGTAGAQTRLRICPLCEATCGLSLDVDTSDTRTGADSSVRRVRADRDDVFSRGFLCPKGTAIGRLHDDPNRLRKPLIRRNGEHVEATWDEAFEEIDKHLGPILAEHGRDSVAAYLGNPVVHNMSLLIYSRALLKALGTNNVFTASTVDQIPKQLASGLLFGTFTSVPVPDIDRSDLLVILGGNPAVSGGSLWTVPDFPGRLAELKDRGGRCIVIDPRHTRTAELAGEHIAIRPGTDAYLLAAIAGEMLTAGTANPGRLAEHLSGLDELAAELKEFNADTVAAKCGIDAGTIRTLAADLAAADSAAVYGRIGTCTQQFGTLASFLVDVVNILTGNLDRPGGAMFPTPAAFGANTKGASGSGRGVRTGRYSSRVRGAPEVQGELPVACLAEEIETPGDGQIRALITIAGNPAVSTPNSNRLDAALGSLEFMLSFDIYLNETTRHADVILPGMSPLEDSHFDPVFNLFYTRNNARFSPPVFTPSPDSAPEWESLLRVTGILTGQGAHTDCDMLDDLVIGALVGAAIGDEHSRIAGRDFDEITEALGTRRGPERVIDFELRSGPHGDAFGADPDGLTLERLEASPHGIDLGPLQQRIPEMLRTPSGTIELSHETIVADLTRLTTGLYTATDGPGAMVLIGRRQLRSNNSWLHNLDLLMKGKHRCTLHIHPDDAERIGLADGDTARVTSRAGSIEIETEIIEDIMPGVASIPHGWGHDKDGTSLAVAADHAGVNSNILADEDQIDPLSGNAVLNGIPVAIEAAVDS